MENLRFEIHVVVMTVLTGVVSCFVKKNVGSCKMGLRKMNWSRYKVHDFNRLIFRMGAKHWCLQAGVEVRNEVGHRTWFTIRKRVESIKKTIKNYLDSCPVLD